jgi:hypothetical protein
MAWVTGRRRGPALADLLDQQRLDHAKSRDGHEPPRHRDRLQRPGALVPAAGGPGGQQHHQLPARRAAAPGHRDARLVPRHRPSPAAVPVQALSRGAGAQEQARAPLRLDAAQRRPPRRRGLSLVVDLPAGATVPALPLGCTAIPGPPLQVTCAVGDLAAPRTAIRSRGSAWSRYRTRRRGISASWARSQRLASTIPRAAPTTSRSSARARVCAYAYARVGLVTSRNRECRPPGRAYPLGPRQPSSAATPTPEPGARGLAPRQRRALAGVGHWNQTINHPHVDPRS